MKKVVVCFCAVVCMVIGCLIPCSAETWEERTPNYGLPLGGSPTWANGINNTRKVIEIVEKATALGMFGGAQPVLIVYEIDANNNAMRVVVLVPASSPYGFYNGIDGGSKATTFKAGAGVLPVYNNVQVTETGERVPFVLYYLQFSGDWSLAQYYEAGEDILTATIPVGQQTNDIFKKVAVWSTTEQAWVQPRTSVLDYMGWGAETTTIPGLQAVIDKYDDQIERLNSDPTPAPAPTYELNIAGIFDGYFNGVRNVLGSFDINLFGINIIGVLIAVLVIAIVAFIVRKLWK